MNSVLLDIIVKGRGFHIPRYPQLILGDGKKYLQGDILDANAVVTEIDGLVAKIIDAAPEALDTLKEIADSLHGDTDIAGTLISKITNVENTVAELADSLATTISELTSDITEDIAELQTGKVDVVSGKQLSTEDYTTAEKTKLTGIEAGALVNPTNVSAFTNDAGYLTEHQSLADYATQAWVNSKGFLTEHQDISNKANIADIPTKTSDLTNDSGFLTQHQDISGKANIADLATVATSGSYDDLINKPDIITQDQLDEIADSISTDVANAFFAKTEENVTVVITTQVPGLSVANLTLNVIYNDKPTIIAQQPVTDANGMCAFKVPNGYTYKIIFPDKPNCHEIIPVQHTAAVLQRSVEVEYVAKTEEEIEYEKGETVRVNLNDHVDMRVSNPSDISVQLRIGSNITFTETTNSYGIAEFLIDPQYYGQTYTVTVPQRENYYIRNNVYSKSYVAEKTTREINFNYRQFNTGIFVVTSDGKEYDRDLWVAAIDPNSENPVDKSTAVFIKIATPTLLGLESQFGIKIEHIRLHNEGVSTGRLWCNLDIAFSSDLNCTSTAPYYYNGKAATQAIIEEAESKTTTIGTSVTVPAAAYCWNTTYTLQDEDLTVCLGFLGTVYLWSVLWSNRVLIDDLLDLVLPEEEKPEGTTYYTLAGINTWVKRTSNLINGHEDRVVVFVDNAVTNAITYRTEKTLNFYAVPFFSL